MDETGSAVTVTEAHADVGGQHVVFDLVGDGPDILLVGRSAWWEAGYVDALRKNFRVLLVDPRGWGSSDRHPPGVPYTAQRWGDDLLSAADAAGVDNFGLWGWGHRGALGAVLAARSDRVVAVACASWPFLGFPLDGMRGMAEAKAAAGEDGGEFDWRASAGLLRDLASGVAADALAARRYPRLLTYGEHETIAPAIRDSTGALSELGFEVHAFADLDGDGLWAATDRVVSLVAAFLHGALERGS